MQGNPDLGGVAVGDGPRQSKSIRRSGSTARFATSRAPRLVAGGLSRSDSTGVAEFSGSLGLGGRAGTAAVAPVRAPLRHPWFKPYRRALVGLDLLAAVVASALTYQLRFGGSGPKTPYGYLAISLVLPLLWVIVLAGNRGYDVVTLGAGADEFRRVFTSFVALTAGFAFISYAAKADLARGFVLVALPTTLLLDLLARHAARANLHRLRRSGRALSRVLVIGSPDRVAELARAIQRDDQAGLQVIGACLPGGRHQARASLRTLTALGVPVLGELDDVLDVVRRLDVDTVAVTGSAELGPTKLRWISWQLEGTGIELIVSPGLMEVAGTRLHVRPLLSSLPLLHVEAPRFTGFHRILKAAFDRGAALLALALLAPIFVMIAVLIRLNSRGPAFFRQTRVGRDGTTFTMIKFRSMPITESE